jgi:uncharacterized protein (TIGR02145 family)
MKTSIKFLSKITISVILVACSQPTKNEVSDKKVLTDTLATADEPIADTLVEEKVIIPTIKIGSQEWMKEDLKVITYVNGDPISEAKSDKDWANYGKQKLGCFRKLKNGTFVYNGFAITDKRGVVPEDFQIPSVDQFKTLFNHLGGGSTSTGKATQALATYSVFVEEWVGDEIDGGLEEVEVKSNAQSGFNAMKGGHVYDFGSSSEGNCSYWWTSSRSASKKTAVDIGYCSQDLGGGQGNFSLSYGFAIRAIKK